MIGTIRKHSKWLWVVIITLTVISFIYWGAAPSGVNARWREGQRRFWHHQREKNHAAGISAGVQRIQIVLLVSRTAPGRIRSQHVPKGHRPGNLRPPVAASRRPTTSASMSAWTRRRGGEPDAPFARRGRARPSASAMFATQMLQPEGLTVTDFQNFVRHNVVIQQLVQTLGSSGELITPQEAAASISANIRNSRRKSFIFSASNYLSSVKVTPPASGSFTRIICAQYRLPDRVQLNYVAFSISNYLAQSKAEWAKTNFEAQVDAIYLQYGAQAFPDAKTPEAAKEKIREMLIRQPRPDRRPRGGQRICPRRFRNGPTARKISPLSPNKKGWPCRRPRRSPSTPGRRNSPRRKVSPKPCPV